MMMVMMMNGDDNDGDDDDGDDDDGDAQLLYRRVALTLLAHKSSLRSALTAR